MDIAHALAADLHDLAVDLAVDGYTSTTLAMIEHNLRRSVTSALGASVTIRTPDSPEPVVVNFVSRTITPDEIKDALVVPLPGLNAPRVGTITFYAGQPDAFTQLLPSLASALQLDPVEIEHPPLPTRPIAPRIEGLHDFSLVNRALGVLLNRGHTISSARAALAQHAERTHTNITAAARAILASAHH